MVHEHLPRRHQRRKAQRSLYGLIAAVIGMALSLSCMAPHTAWAETTSDITGVSLGSGYTVYTSCAINQSSVKSDALACIKKWRQDALNDSNVKINSMTVPEYLNKIGMSTDTYLNPSWSNIQEHIAIQRVIEAFDYNKNHTRPNGETCWTAKYNGTQSANEVLAWGIGDISHAIDLWATEKSNYIGTTSGVTGHYFYIINPSNRAYGLAFCMRTASGEASSSTTDSTASTGLSGTYDFPLNVTSKIMSNGITADVPSTMKVGATIEPTATLNYTEQSYGGTRSFTVRGTWTSSDSSVLSVSSNGVITAVGTGTATLTFTSQGMTWTYTVNVTQDISTVSISTPPACSYTGSEIKLSLSLSYNGKQLVEGTDYTLSYADNTYPGTATVTITGKGNYSGTATRTFQIAKAKIVVTTPDATKAYDGTALTAAGTMTGLVNGETATFATTGSQTGAGSSENTYTITWDGTAKESNYEVDATTGTLTVTALDISDSSRFQISQPSDVTYNGTSQQQPVTVKDGSTGKSLVLGTDYTLSYSNDTTDAGTVTVTVDGTGNYSGTASRTYEILQAPVTVKAQDASKSFGAADPELAATVEGVVSGEDASSLIKYSLSREAGEATGAYAITATGEAGQGNYTVTYEGATFTIAAADISDAARFQISQPSDVTYNGTSQQQPVTVKDGSTGKSLVLGTDYTLSYSNDTTDAGTVTVTVDGTGNYSGTASRTYEIAKASVTVTTSSAKKVYDGTPLTAAGTMSGLVNGEKATFRTTGSQTEAGSSKNTYSISWNGTAKESNYEVVENFGTLTVTAADISDTTRFEVSKPSDVTYNGTSQQQNVDVKDHTTGKQLSKGTDYTLSYSNDTTNAGTVTVTVTGKGSYAGTRQESYTIQPRSIEDAEAQEIGTQYWSGTPVEPSLTLSLDGSTLSAGTDYTVSYSGNNAAGTGSAVATGTGNYTGMKTVTFAVVAASPMYRLYNQWSGEHLFTMKKDEVDNLTALGWTYEGVAWQAPTTSNTPVYRLYNPYSGDHFYTADKAEYDRLGKIGWNKEGIAFYSADSSTGKPIYRLFNKWLTQGTHLFTTSYEEYQNLVAIGWQGEGIAFYSL